MNSQLINTATPLFEAGVSFVDVKRQMHDYLPDTAKRVIGQVVLLDGTLVIDYDNLVTSHFDTEVELPTFSQRILERLAMNPNEYVYRGDIYEYAWNQEYYDDNSSRGRITNHIRHLKSAVNPHFSKKHIKTSRRLDGYGFFDTLQ